MSNPYLARLHNLLGSQRAQQGQKVENATPERTDKTDKTGSVSFVSDICSHFFKSGVGQEGGEGCTNEESQASQNQKTASTSNRQNRQNRPAYDLVFAVLRKRCPAHIEPVRWRQVMEDGERFLAEWGDQAKALGWTSRDLFWAARGPYQPAPYVSAPESI